MTGRLDHLGEFIKLHKLSTEWLIFGRIKGLLEQPVKKQSPSKFTPTQLIGFYTELPMDQRRQISLRMAEMLAATAQS
jgi:hypothetical protein